MGCASGKFSRIASHHPEDAAATFAVVPQTARGQFHSNYALGGKLGAGAFGVVYAGRCVSDGASIAVKVVNTRSKDAEADHADEAMLRAVEAETAILRVLPRSKNIVRFYGSHVGPGVVYLVMERCSTSLFPYLECMPSLTEATLKPLFEDMLSGIGACHAAGIVHRDIKCDNFLVGSRCSWERATVKLCDFGCASKVRTAEARTLVGVCGTAPYMAPEMLCGQRYSAKVDVWAMGVLAHVLLLGVWPYMPSPVSVANMKLAIMVGTSAPTFRSKVGLADLSADCVAWLRSLLCRDALRRPSARQALRAGGRGRWDATRPLGRALRAAASCGAFERPIGEAPCAKFHGVSEASTDTSLGGASQAAAKSSR